MDHDWEELPLIIDELSEFEIKDGDAEYQLRVKLHCVFDHSISSLKRCRNCGLEIFNNADPIITCDEQQVKIIMES